MLIDLAGADALPAPGRADIVVIGAGIAGLVLAARLARLGVHTIVLESGGRDSPLGEHDQLNHAVLAGQPYRGATHGRSRGLGGTSRQWGGAMLPFLPCDMADHTAGWGPSWPVSYEELAPHFEPITRMFRLPEGPFEIGMPSRARSTVNADFIMRSAKWPRFGLRNLCRTLAADIAHDRLPICLGATVHGFRLDANGRVSHVLARSRAGAEIAVAANEVVIAAGAIESTRLLLLLDAANDGRIFAPDRLLGCHFYDHLSTAAAVVVPASPSRLNATFGLSISARGMRDFRIEPSAELRRAAGLPAAFAHLAAVSGADSGFTAVRGLHRQLQSNASINWRKVAALTRDMPWLVRAAWWRAWHGRVLYARDARFELMLVTEQMPNPASRISLSQTVRDPLGVPQAVIDWRTSAADVEAFAALQERLLRWWAAGAFADVARLEPVPREIWIDRLGCEADVFHPGGTTRMGSSPADGVVDGDLRTFRVPNLSVVSTSTFPTGGGANPTFMLMAFALRAAERLAAAEDGDRPQAVALSRSGSSTEDHAT